MRCQLGIERVEAYPKSATFANDPGNNPHSACGHPSNPPLTTATTSLAEVRCERQLGSLLKHYYRGPDARHRASRTSHSTRRRWLLAILRPSAHLTGGRVQPPSLLGDCSRAPLFRSLRAYACRLRYSFLSGPDWARTQTKLTASRKPRPNVRYAGSNLWRHADRQCAATESQLPPRHTRSEPPEGPVGSGPLAADMP